MNTRLSLTLLFLLSLALYLTLLVIPFDLFRYAPLSPISLPEITDRSYPAGIGFLVAGGVLFGVYLLACSLPVGKREAGLILLYGLFLALLLSLTYPVGAGDVVDYVSHGEEFAYRGANPLVVPPAALPYSVFARYSAFRHARSNYGPLWIWISGLVVGLIGTDSLALNILGFKAVAIAGYLAQGLLIYGILRRRAPQWAAKGLLFFAWNPLVLYEFGVNGHNDATMMALALLGILFWEMGRPYLMAAALTLSFLVKIPTIPLLPLFLLAAARRQRSWKVLIGGGFISLTLVALAYLSLPQPVLALTNLSRRAHLFTHSLPAVAVLLLRLGGADIDMAQALVRQATLLLLTTWYILLLWRTWRTPGEANRHAYDLILVLLLFATPWFQPWYVTWAVALAATLPRPQAPLISGIFSASVSISYVVYGFTWFWITSFAMAENGCRY